MHYYQFNIGDYQSHTAHLSDTEDLAYRRMLDWCYLHEKPLPLNTDEISRLIRMRSHSESIAIVLREYFERREDGYIHLRVMQEILKVGIKSEKASESAKARWGKSKDANALPPQSDRYATQDTEPNTQDTKHKTRKPKNPKDTVATPDGVTESVWQDFLSLRKTKRAAVTQTAVNGIEREARKAGVSLQAALEMCCQRGWVGFKADWVAEKMSRAEKAQANMNELTRGLTAPKPFWAKPILAKPILQLDDVPLLGGGES
jgi:uncharacterized protein YdaU (DUF1376 family)